MVFPAGVLLLGIGLSLMFQAELGRAGFFLGATVISVGEVLFMALSGYVLITVTPDGRRKGTIYSVTLMAQVGARILGGAAAFPLLVDGERPLRCIWQVTGLVLVLCAVGRRSMQDRPV